MENISKEKREEILNAKKLVEEYREIEKTINKLELEDIKNKDNSHSMEIAKLNLKLISMKPKVNAEVDKAATIMGIKIDKGAKKHE